MALHEFGHVLHLGEPTSHVPETDSVMNDPIPHSGQTGGNTTDPMTCDRARLLLLYDITSFGLAYPTCLDHAGSGSDNLRTEQGFSANYAFRCVGDPVLFSGSLNVQDLADYDRLGGNLLGSRDVYIKRASPGSENFVTHSSDVTNSSGAWSKSISFSTPADYEWRIRFAGENGLYGSNSRTIRVQWSSGCRQAPASVRRQ